MATLKAQHIVYLVSFLILLAANRLYGKNIRSVTEGYELFFYPPNYLFGLAWTIIYAGLGGIFFYTVFMNIYISWYFVGIMALGFTGLIFWLIGFSRKWFGAAMFALIWPIVDNLSILLSTRLTAIDLDDEMLYFQIVLYIYTTWLCFAATLNLQYLILSYYDNSNFGRKAAMTSVYFMLALILVTLSFVVIMYAMENSKTAIVAPSICLLASICIIIVSLK